MNIEKTKCHKAAAITIAHINDTHSHFESASTPLHIELNGETKKCYVSMGGFARIATRAKQLKSESDENNRPFYFLHAGDCFQGSLYFSHFKGKANSSMLNMLGLTAMTLGNHELDMGNEPVRHFLDDIQFPLLAGNWNLSREALDKPNRIANHSNVVDYHPESQSAKWLTLNEADEPIALFGVSIDKMTDISNPDADTPFESAIETAQRTVDTIRRSGINKIIVLSHLGYEGDKKLAASVNGIGLIVGGHSHVLQGDFSEFGFDYVAEYGERVNDSYIVQAGFHSLALGHCHIEFDASGKVISFEGKNELLIGRRVCIDASLSEHYEPDMYHPIAEKINLSSSIIQCKKDVVVEQHLRARFKAQIESYRDQVLMYLSSPLKQRRLPTVLVKPETGCEITPLVAKSFYTTMRGQGVAVEFAIHNAGGVRTSLDVGPLTKADVAGKLLPFTVPIGHYSIKGRHIALTLEGAINNSLDENGTGSGSFPYCYNLKYVYVQDNAVGERIKHLQIFIDSKWCDIEPDRIYRGTSSAYTMKGKEGYDAILNMLDDYEITSSSMSDCFIEFLKSNPVLIKSKVSQ